MNFNKISFYKLLVGLTLILTLVPVQKLFGFEFPFLYTLCLFWAYILLFIFLGRIKITSFSKIIITFFVLIIIEILFSTFVGTILEFNKFYFPSDTIHYVARMLTYIFFFIIFYYRKVDVEFFIKFFLIILIIGMGVGVLQWIPWFGREQLLQLYPFQDGEEQFSFLGRELFIVRIHGWAQHATANGGLAMLAFVFAISVFLYYKKHNYLTLPLIILSILNIVISQARAGMLSLVFSIVVLYIIHIYITKKPIKPTIKSIIAMAFIFFIGKILSIRDNPFIERIVYRWENLFETSGGGRVDQMEYALSLVDRPLDFLFGISRAVQSRSNYHFLIEVEPINIFVLNGLFGLMLQYGLVIILLIYFLKNLPKFKQNKQVTTLLVSSFVILISYQVFSIAYFFFREMRVGLIPWILFGVTVGIVEYYKKRNIVENQKNLMKIKQRRKFKLSKLS